MIMTILLLATSGCLAVFMVNRLYVMAVHKAIKVKGQHYEKTADPFQFWLFVASACFGLLFGSTVFVAAIAMLMKGL